MENIDIIIKKIEKKIEKKFNNNFTGLILFGSYARNEQKNTSDVDLIITFKELPSSKFKRLELIYDIIDYFEDKYKIEINPIICEEKELGKSILIIEISDYAKIIVDKNDKIKELFKSIQDDYENGLIKKLWYGNNSHLLKFENI